jgi:Domain of unknown function (DUF4203)
MLPASFATPAAVVLTVGGLLACFGGYRLFRFVLGLYGFYLGAFAVTAIMPPTNTWALVVAALVGGVVGALLIVGAYFVGVGLIGAGLAALGLLAGWHAVAHTEPPTVVLVLVSVLGALGALSIVRHVVIFGSALAGSWTAVVGGLALTLDKPLHAAQATDLWVLYPLDPMRGRWWVLGVWIALALGGAVTQLATTSKGGKRKRVAEKK